MPQEKQAQTPTRMPDLEPNPNYKPDPEPKAAPKSKKKKVIRRKRKTTTTTSRNQRTAKTPPRPKKELPRSSVSQPRDHLGRFARKTGEVLWGAAKGTVGLVAGGVQAARSAHKRVQRVQAAGRRRRKLEMRERAVEVAEREQQLRKRKVVRRRR
jgi:hypothetical protein